MKGWEGFKPSIDPYSMPLFNRNLCIHKFDDVTVNAGKHFIKRITVVYYLIHFVCLFT